MPDLGVTMTDEAMRKLDRRLQEIYTEAYKTAVENNAKAIKKLADFDEAALKAQGLTDEAIKLKRQAYANEVLRTTKLKEKIAAEIASTGETAAKIVRGEMLNVYGINNDFTKYSIDRESGVMLDWTLYDKNQLKVLVQDTETPFTRIAYKGLGKDKRIIQRLGNELAQATILGEGQQKLIQRIRKVTGQSVADARRIAQTERTRVSNQATFMSIQEAAGMGIEMEKEWTARMVNTRDTHADLDGRTSDYDEPFKTIAGNELMYPGDPSAPPEEVINCHCGLIERVKDVPDSIKREKEEFGTQSFEEWKEKRAKISELYLTNKAKSGIILPNGEKVNLSKSARITNTTVIAGKGKDRQIDIVDVLVDKYGGNPNEWQKAKGLGYIDYQGESLKTELHWYQEKSIGKVEIKLKPQKGGNWFIDED